MSKFQYKIGDIVRVKDQYNQEDEVEIIGISDVDNLVAVSMVNAIIWKGLPHRLTLDIINFNNNSIKANLFKNVLSTIDLKHLEKLYLIINIGWILTLIKRPKKKCTKCLNIK